MRHGESLDQRQAGLGEILVRVEDALDADNRPSLTGKVKGGEFRVGVQLEPFLALLHPKDHAEAVLGRRHLEPVAAEIARRQGRAEDNLLRAAILEAGRFQVIDRVRSDPAQGPNVVRPAVRIRAIDFRPANGSASRNSATTPDGGIGYDIYGARDTRV